MTDPNLTEDALLDGRLRFHQPVAGYRIAIDPIFLAAAVPVRPGELVLDAGAGTAAATLCLAAREPDCRIVGIELQRELLRIANLNIAANAFGHQAEVIAGDLGRPPPRFSAASFDHVMSNPPFHRPETASASPNPQRAGAYMEGRLDLGRWLAGCVLMLRPGGCLTLIYRADRLTELLVGLEGKVGDVVVYPLWPKADGRAAKRVLIQGRKNGHGPLSLVPGLVLHEPDGRYSKAAEEVLRNGRPLALRSRDDADG